jgi:hypothetical protein
MQSKLLVRRILAIATATPLAALAAAAEAPVTGVWVHHEYDLSYMGFTSYYSCEGLEEKLKQLLLAAGARDDVKVRASCSNPTGGPSRISSAHVSFYALAPAPAAAPPAAAKAEAPAREIGRPAPAIKAAAAPEAGVGAWKSVEFGTNQPLWLESGDCELVEQFDRELVPMLTTRNHTSHMTCVPRQVTLGGINVRFESLAPLPQADRGAAKPH